MTFALRYRRQQNRELALKTTQNKTTIAIWYQSANKTCVIFTKFCLLKTLRLHNIYGNCHYWFILLKTALAFLATLSAMGSTHHDCK